MWPAMWKSFVPRPGNIFFTDDPDNIQLANDYGIVVSTSHHEPMQRATNEWNEQKNGPWDWEKNKDNVAAFMKEGVRRTAMNESFFTLGMRGPTDGPIPGYAVADTGAYVLAAFKDPGRWIGKCSISHILFLYIQLMKYHLS